MLKPAKKEREKDKRLTILAETEDILSALANEDALKIFDAANKGITSSTIAIRELGLTQKRYYSRLNHLIKVGLIEKNENSYQHTMLGKICFRLGETFNNALDNLDRLDLVGKLQKAKTISLNETQEIARALSIEGIPGFSDMADLVTPVRMADTWEKVVTDVIEYVENAEESIYFATQYFDIRVVEAIMRAAQRGVNMNFLSADNESLSGRIRISLSMVTKTQTIKFFFKYLRSKDFRVRIAPFLPYTFVVIDNKYAMVEISKPFTKAFSLAFFFENHKLCERLIETFDSLYREGSDIKDVLTKSLTKTFLKKRD